MSWDEHDGPPKMLGSMSIDEEYLHNMWTSEESQAMAAAFTHNGSLSLPNTETLAAPEKQITFGEMTLEDFLMKVGVVKEENEEAVPTENKENYGLVSPAFLQPHSVGGLVAQQHMPTTPWLNFPAPFPNATTPMGITIPVYDGLAESEHLRPGHGTSSLSPAMLDSPQIQGRKKGSMDYLLQSSFERRHKRMIKNRESAARSRARKQAYTVELEAEVTQLKEENMRLKRQEVLERQMQPVHRRQQSDRVLRRTRSTFW